MLVSSQYPDHQTMSDKSLLDTVGLHDIVTLLAMGYVSHLKQPSWCCIYELIPTTSPCESSNPIGFTILLAEIPWKKQHFSTFPAVLGCPPARSLLPIEDPHVPGLEIRLIKGWGIRHRDLSLLQHSNIPVSWWLTTNSIKKNNHYPLVK